MGYPKVSFAMSGKGKRKRKASGLITQHPEDDTITASDEAPDHLSAADGSSALNFSTSNLQNCGSLENPAVVATQSTDHSPLEHSKPEPSTKPTSLTQELKSVSSPQIAKSLHTMAEPPAKRAKRTDSSAMWDRNSVRGAEVEDRSRSNEGMNDRRDRRDKRDERSRHHGRDDRRYRSRSRDVEKRRERSHSREKEKNGNRDSTRRRSRSRDRHRTRDRSDDRDRRDRKRSTSRDRHRSRRDDPPPRRADRNRSRSRSRSPVRSKHPTRTRSPPRTQPPKPTPSNPTTKPPSSTPTSNPPPPPNPSSQSTQIPKPPTTNKPPSSTKPPPNGTNTITSTTTTSTTTPPPKLTNPATAMDIDSDPETALMRQMMGFAGFKSTKNTKVPGNDVYAVRKEKKTEYRQYMNRVGGFNRPLSPSR